LCGFPLWRACDRTFEGVYWEVELWGENKSNKKKYDLI